MIWLDLIPLLLNCMQHISKARLYKHTHARTSTCLSLYYLPQVTACNALLTRLKENHVITFFKPNHPPHNPVHTEPLHIMSGILFQDKHPLRETISVPLCCIPCKMIKWRLGRFLCLWKSPNVGRIIFCNCSLAVVCWMIDIPGMAAGPCCISFALIDIWRTASVCVGGCVIPVCQWET